MKASYQFLKNSVTGKWVIIVPKRSARPDIAKGKEPPCPFCAGNESLTPPEVYRLGKGKENKPGWQIRIVPNKYPFAPIHEVIIDSPDHAGSFFTYEPEYTSKLLRIYQERFSHWQDKGQVVIFYNYGVKAAASLPHPHAQLAVVPDSVRLDTQRAATPENIIHESKYFTIFIPQASGWPYEVWFVPKKRDRLFSKITSEEIDDLAKLFSKVLKKLQKVLGRQFPFNFYIYYGGDWYLRLMPRVKVLGGFELGSGIFVNTVSPKQAAKELSWTR